MLVSEEEHIAEMQEHQQFVLKAKAKIERLEYELEMKNKLLQERYVEIVYLNNKILVLQEEITKLKDSKKEN